MLAHGHDDFNANDFLNKGQKSKNFWIQISPYVKNILMKKNYDNC